LLLKIQLRNELMIF